MHSRLSEHQLSESLTYLNSLNQVFYSQPYSWCVRTTYNLKDYIFHLSKLFSYPKLFNFDPGTEGVRISEEALRHLYVADVRPKLKTQQVPRAHHRPRASFACRHHHLKISWALTTITNKQKQQQTTPPPGFHTGF